MSLGPFTTHKLARGATKSLAVPCHSWEPEALFPAAGRFHGTTSPKALGLDCMGQSVVDKATMWPWTKPLSSPFCYLSLPLDVWVNMAMFLLSYVCMGPGLVPWAACCKVVGLNDGPPPPSSHVGGYPRRLTTFCVFLVINGTAPRFVSSNSSLASLPPFPPFLQHPAFEVQSPLDFSSVIPSFEVIRRAVLTFISRASTIYLVFDTQSRTLSPTNN